MRSSRDRASAAYWEGRLYRNTYTYRGERREVAGWCVKIQWNGVRRTLRLRESDREKAAAEVAGLWGELRRGGWPSVEDRRAVPREGVGRGGAERMPSVGPRKYVSNLNPGFERELFVALPVDGGVEHYGLGTEDPNVGRMRGREFQEELARNGAGHFRLAHSREATVAVFWHANPMACTYTTLLTHPARMGVSTTLAPRARGWRVLVIESDGGLRRSLTAWLAGDPGVARVEGVALGTELPAQGGWDLILTDREQPAPALRSLAGPGGEGMPRVLTHGAFADSDAIFASFSGVSRGYILCRVAPGQLLAPLTEAFPEGPPRGAGELDRHVKRYFQSIFEPGGSAAFGQPAELTGRELGILDLLARGFADKEVARELGISVWTVHSHLKRIFAKYGVRTRTEAVVRHLQK